MKFRRSKREMKIQRMPLAPLIDVVLFLLMYFIYAGSLAASETQLPSTLSIDKRGAGSGSTLASQVLTVEAGEDNQPRFRLGELAFTDQKQLTLTLSQLPKEPGLIVRAADQAPWAFTAAAFQAGREAGFVRLSFVAGSSISRGAAPSGSAPGGSKP
jgi:biopolymer transport protein ExbD